MMKKILLLIIFIFMLCACNNEKENDIEKIMAENEYIIVDVRTNAEYEVSHIVGATNIPVDEITEEIDLDKEKMIFVYCKSGARSEIASKLLEDLGYKTYDLGAFATIDLPKE